MTEALSKLNFRDVGGLPTEDGQVLRPGMIYRSEGPASFQEVHRSELAALDIRLVCDLRADSERAKDPNDWSGTARLMNLDVTNDLRVETNDGWMALKNDPTTEGAKNALNANYAAIPSAILPHLRPLIEAIVAGETPVLVHCTAGKDRTGVMMAILLMGLRVPQEIVVADYQRSDVFAKNLRIRGGIPEQFEQTFGFRPSEALIDAMIGVDLEFLQSALDAIGRDWGPIETFYAAAGIDADLLERYRDTMTVCVSEGPQLSKL